MQSWKNTTTQPILIYRLESDVYSLELRDPLVLPPGATLHIEWPEGDSLPVVTILEETDMKLVLHVVPSSSIDVSSQDMIDLILPNQEDSERSSRDPGKTDRSRI